MKRSLLDTDIFSEILKDRNPRVAQAARTYRSEFGRLTFSAITVMEIVTGFHKTGQTERLERFLQHLDSEEVLDFDVSAAEIAGRIFADLVRTGQPIGRADPMIAGIALRHDLVLVTGNVAHFRRLQDLGYPIELENWRDEVPNIESNDT